MSTITSPFATVDPWDLVADGYAAEAAMVMAPFSVRALELADLGAEDRVLDVAAGPGTLSLLAAARVREVFAVDFSPRMVAELQAKIAAGGFKNVRAEVGDGQALSYPDATFAAAFSMFGLMFFPDRPRGYAELFRVLAPGGVAIVSSWAPVAESPLMALMFGALRAADPSFPEPKPAPESLENPDVLAAELRSAGFTDVRVVPHTHAVMVTSAADLWERMARSSAPLVMMRRRLGEEEWARRATVARAFVEQRLAASTPSPSTTAWLGLGRKPSLDSAVNPGEI